MEDSYGKEDINLLRWSDGRKHRSPTVDTYFYPHEVRNLVKRQNIIETAISLLLINAYGIIIAGTGLSFYFFYDTQSAYNQNNTNSGFLSGSCIINCGNYDFYPCILVYVFQAMVALGAAIMVLCSLVKSCCGVWYSKLTLCVNFFLLALSLLSAMAVCVFLTISITFRCGTEDARRSHFDAFIMSWGVSGVVALTILVEMILVFLVKKCRRRMTYHRLQ